MFGLNHIHLHTTLITIIFKVAHVGKEALGPRMFTPASKLSFTIPAWDVCLTTHLLQAHGAAPSPGPLLLSYVLRRSTPLPKDEVWVWDRVGVEALCQSLFQQRARIGRGKR